MRAWILVVIGAVLPLVGGASLGSITATEGSHTWSYPVQPAAFLWMSVVLAIAHLLVLVGYLEVARRTTGLGSTLARVGAAGTAAVALCELWSGLVARTDLDAPVLTALDVGYAISGLVIVVGTIGSGLVLRGTGSRFALPLLVNGSFLAVALLVRFFASDGLGIAALTLWSLSYCWLALSLRAASRTRQAAVSGLPTAG
ncbi:hypothetical protein EV138_5263 [Kribbella voronezhensis]|uniref:Uncharacterized protein n=1 Tax=Kribbella voronezhensis TaxID=2512212 RepID=A0A4R7TH51_9ACTN|nr:hypothetical protein [Kribbella voronezhensis]TDU91652.1 hypothetical protein EV138_5263 [Kribbella voronezhensis]